MAANVDNLEHTTIYVRNPNDSEESDGEGGLGNLNRLIVRPPGHSGKAKRGQLCFDAAFECGNLGRADHITELEYDLYIRPDTCRPRSRFWFNFTVENVKQDQRVIFNIVNMGKEYTLYNEEMTPLVRSTSRQKWQRIPRRLLFYHRSLVHRGRKILSIAFGFDREEDVYQFAAAAPYSYSRLQKHLALWEKRSMAFATREEIAKTTQKRRVDLITIGDLSFKDKENNEEQNPAKGKMEEVKKRVVLILARAHGGQPPASFICQGFLDYLGSSSEKARALRNGIVIQVVPMVNPDGVFLGNYRSDLLGSDPNRCWNRATSFAHPALVAINELITKLTSEKTLQLDFIIDIHADVSHEGVFVRGNSYDDVYRVNEIEISYQSLYLPFVAKVLNSGPGYESYRFERHAVLPKFLGARIEAWQATTCLYNADGLLSGAARRALPAGAVDGYSLLVSLGGRRLASKGPYLHYTEDAYIKIGRSLAKALCDYYRHVGVIPPRIRASKKNDARGRRRRRRPVYERERSPSSSPERRVLAARVVEPQLPITPPPLFRALPPRTARHCTLRPRPRPTTVQTNDNVLPIITGSAVRTPRLAVVDLSAYIRTPPATRPAHRAPALPRRAPVPRSPRYTSDEYDTHDSDS